MKNLVPIDEVKTKTLTENISVARSESQYQPMSLWCVPFMGQLNHIGLTCNQAAMAALTLSGAEGKGAWGGHVPPLTSVEKSYR